VQTDVEAEYMCKTIRDELIRRDPDNPDAWLLPAATSDVWGVSRGDAGEEYRLMGVYAKTWPLPWYFRWIDAQLAENDAPPLYLSYWDPVPTQFGRQACAPSNGTAGCGTWIEIGNTEVGRDLMCPHCNKASKAKKRRDDPTESILLVSPPMHTAADSAHALRNYVLVGKYLFLNQGYYYVYRHKTDGELKADRGE
jgi:hypothetical protein